ncbi:glycosyltransferase family 2 protein [Xanthobacter sp. TB0136]|uniref:glycosyltransferase family 2 protein n=1 Tax=Xanthobacter sp. TB0136 TaxID=3459177 RepID=UPI004039B53F
MGQPDISIILTAHREGLLAGVTGRSAQAAIQQAAHKGLQCEVLVVLDRADDLTRQVLEQVFGTSAQYVVSDTGDPGQARNHGITQANGTCATFLDGDDLWSENWLVAAWEMCTQRPDAVLHSACNLVFGHRRMLFWHADSETSLCEPPYMNWLNYWDAMSFARTALYRTHPFKANDLGRGFGHEDWHWNAVTLAHGIAHKPVSGTVHFKRCRSGSQMSLVDAAHGIRWPSA